MKLIQHVPTRRRVIYYMSKAVDFTEALIKKFEGKYEFKVKKGLKFDKVMRVRNGEAYAVFLYMKKNGDIHAVNTMDNGKPYKTPTYTHDQIVENMDKVDPHGRFLTTNKFGKD